MKACIVFIATLAISVFLPTDILRAAAVIISVVAFLLYIFLRKYSKARNILRLSVFSVFAILCILFYNILCILPANSIKGATADINAAILSSELSSSGNKYYTAKLNTINNSPAPRDFNIRLFCSESEDLNDYDEISANVTFFEDDALSSDTFYLSNNILASARSNSDIIVTNKDEFSLLREICLIRDKIIFNIRASLPTDEGDIICGVLFGKRDYIDTETTDLFASAGISHLLAISGLHLSIIVLIINLALGLFGISKITRSILTLLLTFVLMVMTGFTPSIMRASIMILFNLVAQNLRYDYDAPTALSVSAVIICLTNPYSITNVGFLLSFSATIGLIVSNQILDKQRMKFSLKTVGFFRLLCHEILKLILPCTLAFLFTIPVTACVFGYLATYSPLTNLLISPLLPFLLAFSLLAAIFSLTPFAFIFKFLLFVAKQFVSAVVLIAESFSSFKFSRIYFENELMPLIVTSAVAMLLIASFTKRPYLNSFKAALLCIPIICTALISQSLTYSNSTIIKVLGDSSLLIEHQNSRFVSGFTGDSIFPLNKTIDKSANKQIDFLSAACVSHNDISDLTHFVLNNDVKNLTISQKYADTFSTINSSNFSTNCYLSDNFSLSSKTINISSQLTGGSNKTVFEINSFKIIHLEITSPKNLPDKEACDLLIANSLSLPFIENYPSKYFILTDKLENNEHIIDLLSERNTVFLGDSGVAPIMIKGEKVMIKNQKLAEY